MVRKSAWWKGISALPVCVALAVPANYSRADENPSAPYSSRRAAPIEAVSPTEVEPIPEESPDEPAEPDLPAEPAPAASENARLKVEVIQERYTNGAIKIEREMIQDAQGNYIRHGAWTMYEPQGSVVARGRYEKGERQGTWSRAYLGDESPILTHTPYKEGHSPFLSQATFVNGRLHGKWIITDARRHKISEISFVDGQRDGTAKWWYADGGKMQEIVYRDGLIDGTVQKWDSDGTLIFKEEYMAGRVAREPQIAYYKNGQKRSEESRLSAQLAVETPDDWWNGRFAVSTAPGKDIKHGPYASWHENGQQKSQGEYENGLPAGKATWWYATGQRSMEGYYQAGKAHGAWTWYHANGQKSIQGEYKAGQPAGKWYWWQEDGRLTRNVDLSPGEGSVSGIPTPVAETTALPSEPAADHSVLKR